MWYVENRRECFVAGKHEKKQGVIVIVCPCLRLDNVIIGSKGPKIQD